MCVTVSEYVLTSVFRRGAVLCKLQPVVMSFASKMQQLETVTQQNKERTRWKGSIKREKKEGLGKQEGNRKERKGNENERN